MGEGLAVEGEYQVIFTGLPVHGADINLVRKNFENKFKLPPKRLNAIFNGGQALLQKNLDWLHANKYSDAMKEMGALCEVVRGQESAEENIGLAPCPKCNSLQIGDSCGDCGFDIKTYRLQMSGKGFVEAPDLGYIKNRRDTPRRLNVDRRDDVRYEDKRRLVPDRRKNNSDWYSE